MLVFVYGTLKQGFGNHSVMQSAGGELVGVATRQFAKLIHLGGFPGLLETNNPDDFVYGEVYRVSDLRSLDWLEGYHEPTDSGMYLRRARNIVLEDGNEALAYLYVWNRPHEDRPVIEGGCYV